MSQHDKNAQGFATRVIHAGQEPDPTTGALMPPIYANSTYLQDSPGVHKGFDYGRSHNPTRWALERCVADIEGGRAAFAFDLTGSSCTKPCVNAKQDCCSGQKRQSGITGVHWIAPNSMMAWLKVSGASAGISSSASC